MHLCSGCMLGCLPTLGESRGKPLAPAFLHESTATRASILLDRFLCNKWTTWRTDRSSMAAEADARVPLCDLSGTHPHGDCACKLKIAQDWSLPRSGILALPQSIWAKRFDVPGLFSAPKFKNV